jgi:hypothetical protein
MQRSYFLTKVSCTLPLQSVPPTTQHALPAFVPPCTPLSLFAIAAGHTPNSWTLVPPGSLPHSLNSQQLSFVIISPYLILNINGLTLLVNFKIVIRPISNVNKLISIDYNLSGQLISPGTVPGMGKEGWDEVRNSSAHYHRVKKVFEKRRQEVSNPEEARHLITRACDHSLAAETSCNFY